jgi:hypothetical protein
VAASVAREVPVVLAGGLRPGNVAAALREVAAIGVDVASGVEALAGRARPKGPPRKDPLAVALFAKRAHAARGDRPHVASRPRPVDAGLLEADERGRWGPERDLGGRFVPETLVPALVELERTYSALRHDPTFWAELASCWPTTPAAQVPSIGLIGSPPRSARGSASTSSARTSTTPARTRSTTCSARRC